MWLLKQNAGDKKFCKCAIGKYFFYKQQKRAQAKN
jgi:hypothetical protein